MNKVPCCCNPQSIKTKDKCCSVPCRPAENWRVPARARMLLGAYGAEPEWRRWAPAYRPAARRPSPTRQEPQQEEELPSMGLWWQVLKEERELEQERLRTRRDHVLVLRAALPLVDARDVRRHRLGVAAVLEEEMREDGFPEAADSIRQLLLLNDQLVEIVRTNKLRWDVGKLSEDDETLQNVAAGLMAAEMAKRCRPPRVAQQADILYAVVEATLRLGPPYYWLVEQLLLLLVAAVDGYRQDDGFREARARYAYGYVLADKIGHQSAAQEQLEEARQISAGKLWTLGRVDRRHDKFTEKGELIQESDDGEEEDDTKDGKDKDGDYKHKDSRDNDNKFGKEVVKEIVKEAAVKGSKVVMEGGKEIVENVVKEVVMGGGMNDESRKHREQESQDPEVFVRELLGNVIDTEVDERRDSVHLEYILKQRKKQEEAESEYAEPDEGGTRDKHRSRRTREGGDSREQSSCEDVIEKPHATLYFCVLEMMCRVLVRLSRAVRRENPLEAVRLISMALRRLGEPALASRQSILLFELGLCYEMLEDYKMALESFLAYVKQPKDTVNMESICSAYLEISYCYRSLGDKEMATEYLYKVLDASVDTDNHELIGVSHRFLGQGLLLMERYNEASDRLEESMRLFLDLNMMNDVDRVRIIHGITKGYEVMPYMANLLNNCEEDPREPAYQALLSWKMHHMPFFNLHDEKAPSLPPGDLYNIIIDEDKEEGDPRIVEKPSDFLSAKRATLAARRKSVRFNYMEEIIWEKLYEILPSSDEEDKSEGKKTEVRKMEDSEVEGSKDDEESPNSAVSVYNDSDSEEKTRKWMPIEQITNVK